jgi:hypothetical protein
MVGQRQHASLENDAETNQAAWEAAKGAAWGGSKVNYTFSCLSCQYLSVLVSLHPYLAKKLLLSIIWSFLEMTLSRLRHAKLFLTTDVWIRCARL